MERRGIESPMDFQWQTHAPADATSPFHKLAMDHNQKDKKRSYSIFDSPAKPNPSQPPVNFSQPHANPAQSPFRSPSFTTPRKPAAEIDFSSGPENLSSPEQADSEATPEPPKPNPFQFISNDKDKRNSLFGLYGRFAPAAGRGEITRSKRPEALERRVHKRRRRGENFDRQLILARRGSEDTSDDESSPSGTKTPKTPVPQEVGYLATMFTFIERYPNAPALLAKYLQLAFNAAILLGCLYAILSFWLAIQSDVNKASEDAAQETLAEMAACAKNFVDNRCGSDNRLPALESVCDNWELCMNRDPNSVKRAALSAHTFAEILNSFVEPISLKTMLFSVLLVVSSLLVSNATFGLFRRSYAEHHQQDAFRHPSGQLQPPRQPSYGMGQYGHYGQQGLDWLPNSPNQGWNQPQLEHPFSPQKDRARSKSPQKRIELQ